MGEHQGNGEPSFALAELPFGIGKWRLPASAQDMGRGRMSSGDAVQ